MNCIGADDSIIVLYLYEIAANGDSCAFLNAKMLFALCTSVLNFSAEVYIHIGFEVVTQTCMCECY